MAQPVIKPPVKTEGSVARPAASLRAWRPFESLHREMNRLLDDFEGGLWSSPLRRSIFDAVPSWGRDLTLVAAPAVDISESDKAYEIKADLPGMDEKDIEVNVANGGLTIKAKKEEETEENRKDYYIHERHFGSFERFFQVPSSVDTNNIEATFKKGVLTVTLPKTAEAQKAGKKISVKAG